MPEAAIAPHARAPRLVPFSGADKKAKARPRLTAKNNGPDQIDVHVGLRVRARRLLYKMSQEKLAEGLGVKIFEVLVEKYPDFIERDELDGPTGYTRSSRNTYLQRLGARRLIETNGTQVRAAENLF